MEEPAETSQPETVAEFARRVAGRFVLRGPRERKEGEEAGKQSQSMSVLKTPESDDLPVSPLWYPEEDQLIKRIKGHYQEDPFFQKILDSPSEYRNFEMTQELIRIQLKDRTLLCIPDLRMDGQSIWEIVISQAHSLLAHLGAQKTLTYLRDHVWWKTITVDVNAYCATCTTCQRTKPSNQKPYGLLHPLQVPTKPWELIGIDFVGLLPMSTDRDGEYDAITVIIDRLTSMVHLVPSRVNYTAREVAELVFDEVYKHHGLPRSIVSDRDVLFMSTFWTNLNRLIGMNQQMSSAYHPESDGATERANQTVGQMLRAVIGPSQMDWVARLPAIEFAINITSSELTGISPFEATTGRTPRTMVWDNPMKDEYPSIRVYLQKRKQAMMAAHDSMLQARVKQTRMANRKRQPCPFKEKDLAYVSTKNLSLPKGLTRKLTPKFIGPYCLLKSYGNNSFLVDLPHRLRQRGIHPVFHSSLLRIHIPNDDQLFPGRLDNQVFEFDGEREPEWQVNSILSHRGTGKNAEFQVEWKTGDVTWLSYDQVSHLDALGEYLDLLGLANITGLMPRDKESSRDDPRLDVRALSLREDISINTPPDPPIYPTSSATPIPTISPSFSWSDDLKISLYAMTVPQDKGDLLYFAGHGRDILIRNPEHPEEAHLIMRDQLKLYVAYSHALHNKGPRSRHPGPLGYKFFAQAFNSEGLHSSASYLDEHGTIVSTGSSIEASDIIGDDDEEDTTVSTIRMVQMEKMVWHTALSATHQREKMELRRAGQRKEKNFGRKQTQKLNKKGLGKVRKETDLTPNHPVAGPSSSSVVEEVMVTED